MITYLLYIGSAIGAVMTLIGFLALIIKPFRACVKKIIKKTIKDDEQDTMIKEMHSDIKSVHQSIEIITQQLNKLNESNLTIMRNNITLAYYKYTQIGEIPIYVREGLIKQREQYRIAGGNSYIDTIFPEILEIPIKY